MALPSSAQAAIIAAAVPARPPASVRSSLPSVFKRVELSEFAGLKSTYGCITYGTRQVRENSLSLFDALASQVIPTAQNSGAVRGETVARLTRVAINGFGRIGRDFLRCWHGRESSSIEVVAINDINNVENAAHLLKYDSLMGKFEADVKGVFKASEGNMFMCVGGKKISVISQNDPTHFPWKELDIDLVIEGTGNFVDRTQAQKHIHAGAKKVIITALPRGKDIPIYVVGINDHAYSHHENDIISNGSSTTNCLALLINILQNEFGGIETGTISATLSSSSGQSLLDGLHCDKRIGRAAGLNIVPTAMDISKTLSRALPSRKLEEKLTGIAMVVPTPNVSVVDLAVHVKKLEDDQEKITVERVNTVFKNAAAGKCLKGILEVSDGQLVSMDYCGSNASAIVDTTLTMVMGENMIRVVAWYDNEWAYSQRLVDLAETVHTKHEEVISKTECSHFNEQIVEAKCHEYETHFN